MKTPAITLVIAALLSVAASAAPVRIGAVYANSGAFTPLDEPSWRGAQAAAAFANRAAGASGQRVELVRVPYDSTPESAAQGVRAALAKDPSITAFVGASDSGVALAAGREARRAGKVFVTSGATSPLLPAQVGSGFFLACFGDNVQAAAAAEWLLGAKKARKVCVVYDTSKIYTRLLRRYFEEAFKNGGGAVAESVAYRAGEPTGLPARLGECNAVFLASVTAADAVNVIRKLRAAGFNGPIVGGDGFDASGVWEGEPLAENVYYTTHAFPAKGRGAAGAATLAGLRGNYPGGAPNAFGGLGFDATRVLLAAMNGAADKNLASRIQNGAPLAGVTGPIAYTNGRRVPSKPVAIIDAGRSRQTLAQITPGYVPRP